MVVSGYNPIVEKIQTGELCTDADTSGEGQFQTSDKHAERYQSRKEYLFIPAFVFLFYRWCVHDHRDGNSVRKCIGIGFYRTSAGTFSDTDCSVSMRVDFCKMFKKIRDRFVDQNLYCSIYRNRIVCNSA